MTHLSVAAHRAPIPPITPNSFNATGNAVEEEARAVGEQQNISDTAARSPAAVAGLPTCTSAPQTKTEEGPSEANNDSLALTNSRPSALDAAAAETSRSTTPAATELPTSEAHPYVEDFILKMSPEKQGGVDAAMWAETGRPSQETNDNGGPLDEGCSDQQRQSSETKNSESKQSLLVPCLAVFSSNYNFVVTSIALFIMNQDPVYQQALESVVGNGTIKMLSYAGAIAGMCIMGYLGDLIGRRLAMVLTLFLVAFGALSSAVLSWGTALSVAVILGVFRFVLGVGSGGVYPLSAVTAAEGSASEKVDDRCLRVSWAYSMNVPGILFPYVVALVLWWATDNSVEITFRVLLGFGALPAFLVWMPAWRMKDSKEFVERDFAAKLLQVFVNRTYWRQLLGTGVCWLLYDVTAYGILLVQPEITQMIWGHGSTVFEVIWHNIVLNAIGIPGCYMGILVLRQMGVKWLQFWGFMGLAGSALLLAATSHVLQGHSWAQLGLLAVVNFFINWGASITTFILPSVVFPPGVRSTYSGISAALGKVGAVAGIYCMKAVLSTWGLAPMMVCAGVPSLIAAVLTFFYVSPVPTSAKSSLSQCFGSLAGCIPFIDCRRRKVA